MALARSTTTCPRSPRWDVSRRTFAYVTTRHAFLLIAQRARSERFSNGWRRYPRDLPADPYGPAGRQRGGPGLDSCAPRWRARRRSLPDWTNVCCGGGGEGALTIPTGGPIVPFILREQRPADVGQARCHRAHGSARSPRHGRTPMAFRDSGPSAGSIGFTSPEASAETPVGSNVDIRTVVNVKVAEAQKWLTARWQVHPAASGPAVPSAPGAGQRPSLADYVTGTGPRVGSPPPEVVMLPSPTSAAPPCASCGWNR
jgi:hypothetical protein